MSIKIQKYVGTGRGVFVLGHAFGPCLLAVDSDMGEAFDEWDERFGERFQSEDRALADYEGDTPEAKFENAMICGDIRINDGGTAVWVDPYEWVREFKTEDEAIAHFREACGTATIEVIE
jgi:hypothetical protein